MKNTKNKQKKNMLKILTSGSILLDAEQTECIIRADVKERDYIIRKALDAHRYINYIENSLKIKSFVICTSGNVYASNFKTETLIKHLESYGYQFISLSGTHSYLALEQIESAVDYQYFKHTKFYSSYTENEFFNTDYDIDTAESVSEFSSDMIYYDIFLDNTSDDVMSQRIRSVLILSDGHIYPSTFNVRTLKKKIERKNQEK